MILDHKAQKRLLGLSLPQCLQDFLQLSFCNVVSGVHSSVDSQGMSMSLRTVPYLSCFDS